MTDELLKGFNRFREKPHPENPVKKDYYIIHCSDSVSSPIALFDQPPGNYLGHSPIGAIVRPYSKGTALAAGLQLGLELRDIKTIIVLGHSGCAAVQELVDKKNTDMAEITSFIAVAESGLTRAKSLCGDDCSREQLIKHSVEQTTILSTENLRTYPIVDQRLRENALTVKTWVFDEVAMAIEELDMISGRFKFITEPVLRTGGGKQRATCAARGIVLTDRSLGVG